MKKQPPVNDLGRNKLVKQLTIRMDRHFASGVDDSVFKSLVIGLFGEWGSGKSWILERLQEHYKIDKKKFDDKSIIIPVWFNPWRYEAEEHLIVPLLMTIYDTLKKHENVLPDNIPLHQKISDAAGYFWQSAIAFSRAWTFKVGPVNFSSDKALEAQEELQEKQAEADKLPSLHSCYYDFEKMLQDKTGNELKFLFLIDDIDRCLPERAVQMLEAIKLFLDVPGCVFVLGVDDEVIERGIKYRYKDYNQDSEPTNGNDPDSLPPITGMEYLEKIIQLPVRLPLMQERQVAGFLIDRYPSLFKAEEQKTGEKSLQQIETGRSHVNSSEAKALLELFARAIPRIPRKQIRAAELLDFLLGLAGNRLSNKLLLARLVLLQLFAPDVFRHLRRVNEQRIRTLVKWQEAGNLSLVKLDEINTRELGMWKAEKENNQDTWKADKQPLIKKLLEAGKNRVNFDPCRVFHELEDKDIPDNLADYFHLIEEQLAELPPEKLTETEKLIIADLSDQKQFLNNLFHEEEEVWRKALAQDELRGKVLDDTTFAEVLKKLEADQQKQKNLQWQGLLAAKLNRQQQSELNQKYQWQDNLVKGIQNSENSMASRRRDGLLLGNTGWLPEDIDRLVPIAKGDFLYGEDRKTATIEHDYWIGRYPVTNSQYKRFVEAGGYKKQDFWSTEGLKKLQEEEWQEPGYWDNPELSNPLFPVVGISWYEAVAFCKWLHGEVQQNPAHFGLTGQSLQTHVIRPPTNHEWERAARGTDGRIYPWGDEKPDARRANIETSWEKDDKNRSTTPVIMFPNGTRKEGDETLWDMSGNVWNWTSSLDKNGYSNIRGGSWYYNPVNSRCSIRLRNPPINRANYMGFRVVFSQAADF